MSPLAQAPHLRAHEFLQRGLLARNAIYLPAHLTGVAPAPEAWRDQPVGLLIEGAADQPTRGFLVWPLADPAEFSAGVAPGATLCLTLAKQLPEVALGALEEALGVEVVVCTSEEVRGGPAAKASGVERELQATLKLARESELDPGVAYADMLSSVEGEVYMLGLEAAMPQPWLTHAFIALCVVIFAAEELMGLKLSRALSTSAGMALGAGEVYRLLTVALVHGGLMHVGLNMYVFAQVGPLGERLFGRPVAALIFALSTLAGSVASAWVDPFSSGVGASGGIFGAAAAVGAYAVLRPDLPTGLVKRLGRPLAIFLGANLLLGFALSVAVPISNSAHLGGLLGGALAGALFALCAPKSEPEEAPEAPAQPGLLVVPIRRPPPLGGLSLTLLGLLTVLYASAASVVAWQRAEVLPLARATLDFRYLQRDTDLLMSRSTSKKNPLSAAQVEASRDELSARLAGQELPNTESAPPKVQVAFEALATIRAAYQSYFAEWASGPWGPNRPPPNAHLKEPNRALRAALAPLR